MLRKYCVSLIAELLNILHLHWISFGNYWLGNIYSELLYGMYINSLGPRLAFRINIVLLLHSTAYNLIMAVV